MTLAGFEEHNNELLRSKLRGFQTVEIEASKILLDTFPLLFVHVALR